MVQLSNLVSLKETVAPKELRRFNQLRSITITANLAPGYTLGQALASRERGGRAKYCPAGMITDLSGQSREFRDASSNIAFIFVLALALHLSRAVGAVRELPRSPDDHADGAACR